MVYKRKYLRVAGQPLQFSGSLRLPASKSYLHRALFVASLASTPSRITNCGHLLSDDIIATIDTLSSLGNKVISSPENHGTLRVLPDNSVRSKISIFAKGSGTTARFAISFAAAAANPGTLVRLAGDDSLSKRPMEEIYHALTQLGVRCQYEKGEGRLPILIPGGGIRGGLCVVDGSISSQFVSSLLISCARAQTDCTIRIKNPSRLVSRPYIDATLKVLSHFGFEIKVISSSLFKYVGFRVRGNQVAKGRNFSVPGDMSTAAALIGATVASHGRVILQGVNPDLPQSDSAIIPIARKFGAFVSSPKQGQLLVKSTKLKSDPLNLDLGDSPDLVPVVAGLSAALGRNVSMSRVGHLRFKESDRLSVLAREFDKLGVPTRTTPSSLTLLAEHTQKVTKQIRKPILLNPERDHRMLMALTIAGLSGRYGELRITNPDCVRKSYPEFVKDLQALCHETNTIRILVQNEGKLRGGNV